jgi:hypothetical protein
VELRERLHLHLGDVLNVQIEDGRLILKPKQLSDRAVSTHFREKLLKSSVLHRISRIPLKTAKVLSNINIKL